MTGTTIQVRNLFSDVDVCQLCNVMKKFGRIIKAEIDFDAQMNSLRVGYIVFDKYPSAYEAVRQLNGQITDIAKPLIVTVINSVKKDDQYTNLYVKNFNKNWDDIDLECAFKKFGKVQHAEVARDNEGLSKGFGFVDFMHHSSADCAVQKMHEKEIEGRVLYVQPHLRKEDREKCNTVQNLEKGVVDKSFSFRNLKVVPLPLDFSAADLQDLFENFGLIESVKVPANELGESKGYGFVCFKERKCAEKACKMMNGYFLKSKRLKVSWSESKSSNENHTGPKNLSRNEGEVHKNYKSNKMYASVGSVRVSPLELFSFKGSKKS